MKIGSRAGLYQFDPDGVEAKALEDRLGIPVIRHGIIPRPVSDIFFSSNRSFKWIVKVSVFVDVIKNTQVSR